jgi:hypothetical protein
MKLHNASKENQMGIISNKFISNLQFQSKSQKCKLTIVSKFENNHHGINSEFKNFNFKENLKNKENLILSEHKRSNFNLENRFIQNFNNRSQMTPNLRKNLKFKRNLYSQNKKSSKINSNILLRGREIGAFNKMLQSEGISEFQISSRNQLNFKKTKTEKKKEDNGKLFNFRKLSKKLFKIQKSNKIKTIKWQKKKQSDERFIRNPKNIDQMTYKLNIQKEQKLLSKDKKSKKRKNSFLTGTLDKMTFNSKLILKNNLRLFYKNLRTNFFDKPEKKKASILNYKHKISFSGFKEQQPKKHFKKIRKIAESPCKVLDAPGIIDDFYTHTQEVSSKGILFISLNNTVYSFNLLNNKTQKIKTSFQNSPSSIKVNPSGNKVAIGDTRGNLNLIDIEKNCYLFKNKVHRGRLGVIDYLNPKVLITGGKDSFLNIIDLRIKSKPKNFSNL